MKNLIKYPFQKLYTFFLWSSGANLDILEQAPTDKNKYFGIGGTIIFTALMASFAGGYAFFTAFREELPAVPGMPIEYTFLSEILSVFFGLFWGALIFNLDRYIVSTFGVGDGKKTISRQEIIAATPRLIMAIILGFVISTPLELKLFEKEIKAEIKRENLITSQEQNSNAVDNAKEQNLFYSDQIKTLDNKVKSRSEELTSKKNKRDDAYDKYMCELNGTCGTGIPGEGPVFREAKENYLTLNSEYQKIEREYSEINKIDNQTIIEYQETINENLKKAQQKVAALETEYESRDGLLARLHALNLLTKQDISLLFAKWLITFLFIFIEIAPILFKMMTERGAYDDILDRIEHEVKVEQLLLQSNINEEINTAVKVHADKNSQKLNAELTANKDLLESIAKAQAEIAQVAIEEWKKEQIEKVKKNPSSMIKS